MAEKKARMTDRERVEAILRREKPDRVPIWPFASGGFACVYTGTSIADAYNKPDVSLAAERKTCHDFGWVFVPWIGYAALGGWEFGGDIRWPSGEFSQAPSVLRHPAEKPEDVWKLKAPDVETAGIGPIEIEFCKLASQERLDNEPFNVETFVGGPFTVAGNICGADQLCKWLIKKPQAAHRLLRLTTEYYIEQIQCWKNLFGTDGVLAFGGEATTDNNVISAKQFEDFVMPLLKEGHEAAIAIGYKNIYCHICGEQNENLPYWAQVPMGDPGIVSIGHEIELETAGKFFPNDVISGNLEPAIIQVRTPEEVYEATKKNIEDGMTKCPGGYIFSPGCETPPMAPIDNIMAMTKAANDVGWYD